MPRVEYVGDGLHTGRVKAWPGWTEDVSADLAAELVADYAFVFADRCSETQSDGSVCGRDLPCQYHD